MQQMEQAAEVVMNSMDEKKDAEGLEGGTQGNTIRALAGAVQIRDTNSSSSR